MPALTDCIPQTAEVTMTGVALKAIVDASPGDYVLTNRGPCECCGQCYCCDMGIYDLVTLTVSGIVASPNCVDCVGLNGTWTLYGNRFTNGLGQVICLYETAEQSQTLCVPNPLTSVWSVTALPGEACVWDLADFVVGEVATTTGTLCKPQLTDVSFTFPNPPGNVCDYSAAVATISFTPDVETRKWWCVDKATSPFRECVQNVTSAVGGPYTTKALCEADVECLPCNYYCVKLQTLSGGVVVPNTVTWACQQLSGVTVGQVIDAGDVRKTIQDGPFTVDRCQCPPCTGGVIIDPSPACDAPVVIVNYSCLAGICVPVTPGTEASYGTLYPDDATCGGLC